MTNLYRLVLIIAAVVAGILNGSVLAAPVLILAVYLLCVLVAQAQTAHSLYLNLRIKELGHASSMAR